MVRTVFLDEGALDGRHRYPSVCAVVVDDVAAVNSAIEDAIHKLALKPDFRLEKSFDGFRKRGFHHVDDPVVAQQSFLQLLPSFDIEWWCASNLNPDSDPYDTLPDQFEWLLEGILRKSKDKNIRFVFEQNSRLNGLYPMIVEKSTARAKYDPKLVSFGIGTKSDRALSIADYCISIGTSALTAWMEFCCDTYKLTEKHEYRSYVVMEPSCSVFFAWDFQRSLSSRSSGRLHERTYFDFAGVHHETCRNFIDVHVTS